MATRDIEAGEVVMVDTGLATHLLCSTRLTNCCHCTVRLDLTRAKPSPISRTARFCCYQCIQAAMASYHPVEAKINIQKMFWNKKEEQFEELSGNILLSYRCITQKPLNFFLDKASDYDNVDDSFGVEFTDKNDKLVWDDYRNLYNLAAHRDRKTKDELLSLTIRTVMFVIMLRYGGYFGQKETPYGAAMSKAEATIADIVFHIQEGIQYNLHQVQYHTKNKRYIDQRKPFPDLRRCLRLHPDWNHDPQDSGVRLRPLPDPAPPQPQLRHQHPQDQHGRGQGERAMNGETKYQFPAEKAASSV